MIRQTYVTAMGTFIGAIAAGCFGHTPLWLGIGVALGLIWPRLAPETAGTSQPDRCLIPARAWLNQVVALRRVSFVIGMA
jgi:hypothetical protein